MYSGLPGPPHSGSGVMMVAEQGVYPAGTPTQGGSQHHRNQGETWLNKHASPGSSHGATSFSQSQWGGEHRPGLAPARSASSTWWGGGVNTPDQHLSSPSAEFARQQSMLQQQFQQTGQQYSFNQGPRTSSSGSRSNWSTGVPSPLRAAPASPLPSQFHVYDMKSLAAALSTVQAGTGAVARVFQSCSFRPRLPGLTKLVSQLTREGNWQKGLEVFEALHVLGVVPDTTITNAAISACDKGGQWEKALQVFKQMEAARLPRDAITYSAVISALSKGRQWSLAIDVFNHMSDAGIECDAVTCCSLITALDKGGQWQLAEQVFVQMYTEHPQFGMLLQCTNPAALDMITAACNNGAPGGEALALAATQAQAQTAPAGPAAGTPPWHQALAPVMESMVSNEAGGGGGGAHPGSGMPPASMAALSRLYRSVSAFPKIDEDSTLVVQEQEAAAYMLPQMSSGSGSARRNLFPAGDGAAGGGSGHETSALPLPGQDVWNVSGGGSAVRDGSTSGGLVGDVSQRQQPMAPGTPQSVPLAPTTSRLAASAAAWEPGGMSVSTSTLAERADVAVPAGLHTPSATPDETPTHASLGQMMAAQQCLQQQRDSGLTTPRGDVDDVMQQEGLRAVEQQLLLLSDAGLQSRTPGVTLEQVAASNQAVQDMMLLMQAGAQQKRDEAVSGQDLFSGLMRQLSGMRLPPHSPASAGGWDMQQQVAAELHQQLMGTSSNASAICRLAGLGSPMMDQPPASPLNLRPGGSGLMPTSPLQRTTSCPPGTPRGLLRTTSLNIKKSAPNRVCCNALLAAYARAVPTQWQRALRLLGLMWQCSGELQPDIVSYNTVIKACGNAHQVELGFQVYKLMCSRGVQPTVATYGTLICIAADVGSSQLVKEAWGWLQASELEVHVTAANAYLSALVKEGDWSDAQALVSNMLSPSGICRPNAVTFSVMSAAYLSRGEPSAINKLYHQMLCVGVQPSANTLGQLVCVLAGKNLWDDALAILTAMCRHESGGARPSLAVFTSVFVGLRDAARAVTPGDEQARAYIASKAAEARQLLKSQPGWGHHVDVSLYRAMVGTFAAVKEADVCLDLFNSMLSAGVAVDADVVACVLGALCGQATWSKVVQLVYVLQSSGASSCLSPSIVVGVLQAMQRQGAWLHAYQLLKVVSEGLGPIWSGVFDVMKATGESDLLLLALLVDKELTGAWAEALCLFNWQQSQSRGSDLLSFTRSPEAYYILVELLYVHGGVEGLHQAVRLIKSAHEQGLLAYYSPPGRSTPVTGSSPVVASPDSCSPPPTCQTASGPSGAGGASPESDSSSVASVRGGRGHSAVPWGAEVEGVEAEEEPRQVAGAAMRTAVGGLSFRDVVEGGDAISREVQEATGGEAPADKALRGVWGRQRGVADAPASAEEASAGESPAREAQPEGTVLPVTAAGLLEAGSWVVLQGPSPVHAMVVLLAWVSSVADAARLKQHVLTSPFADILIMVPFTEREAAEQLMGISLPELAPADPTAGGQGSASLAQLRRITCLVLEGGYLGLLGGATQDFTPEQKEVLVLEPPGVLYFPDSANPCLVHVSLQSLYQAVLDHTT